MKLPAGAADAPPAAPDWLPIATPPRGVISRTPREGTRSRIALGESLPSSSAAPPNRRGPDGYRGTSPPLIGSAVISNPSTSHDRGTCSIRLLIRDALSDPYTEHVARRDLAHVGSPCRTGAPIRIAIPIRTPFAPGFTPRRPATCGISSTLRRLPGSIRLPRPIRRSHC